MKKKLKNIPILDHTKAQKTLKVRGNQVGLNMAEAFEVMRKIEFNMKIVIADSKIGSFE